MNAHKNKKVFRSMYCISERRMFIASDDKPKPEDYQRGLKVGPSSTEVPRKKKKPGEPADSLVDTRHPELMTPEMEEYLRFPTRTHRLVFDPQTGKPVPQGMLPPGPSSSYDITPISDILKKHSWKLGRQILKREARDMLDKDKRLDESDKDTIVKAISEKAGELEKDGRTLGDIVREEVEKYLANRGNAPKTPLQIDAEAGVRILELHFDNMFALRFEEINPDSKQATEAEVLAAIDAIPNARLRELSLSWVTIKSLMGSIADYTIYPSVRKAIEEKLKN